MQLTRWTSEGHTIFTMGCTIEGPPRVTPCVCPSMAFHTLGLQLPPHVIVYIQCLTLISQRSYLRVHKCSTNVAELTNVPFCLPTSLERGLLSEDLVVIRVDSVQIVS